MMRVFEKQNEIVARLDKAGVSSPAQQARIVLEKYLNLAPLTLMFARERILTKQEEEKIERAVGRLLTGEPLQYVLGTQAFLDLELIVTPDVLIPRPETEELALLAVTYLKDRPRASVLDLCTGSGALALFIKHRVPTASVTASDLSREALFVAKRNAQKYGLDISFLQSDLFCAIGETFDLIVSNPPYVKSADCKNLSPSVRDFEPMTALDGGADGLMFYRAIAKEAPRYLKRGGRLMLEVGFDQAHAVENLLEESFLNIEIRRDMQGVERIVCAQKRGD